MLCGLRGSTEVPLPSDCVRVCYPHDLELHRFARDEVVAEIVASSGGLCVGSHLLFDDGGGDGVPLLDVSLHETVCGKLVPIHS